MVVFPSPEGPTRPMISWGWASKEAPEKTRVPVR